MATYLYVFSKFFVAAAMTREGGYEPVLKKIRWILLKRKGNLFNVFRYIIVSIAVYVVIRTTFPSMGIETFDVG